MDEATKQAVLKTIGDRIRMAREIKGFTPLELATMVDTKRLQIDRIETGEVDLAVTMLLRIAAALGVKPTLLLP